LMESGLAVEIGEQPGAKVIYYQQTK